ncbi:MAG TPA: lipopolysaccharide biosynthesis protein, partial [Clostridiaceae bacterium]|nr:lipopolysaccharide biosynthesis protein [Clostridiaceae bacterium]
MAQKQDVVGSLFWKLAERFGVQIIQFLLQIVLARLLSPDHYGVLALMITFIAIANVFIQSGFNTALIQGKEIKDEDFSSVFWLTLSVAAIIYIILFFSAPFIGQFFNMPEFTNKFRVLALVLFPGALNSVQLAKISREMDFKKVFYSNIGGILVSGAVGIVLAFWGKGVWALVAQNITNVLIATIVMWFTVRWHPRLIINFKRLKILFSFGWKLMVSGMMDVLYLEMRGLVIGKKYKKSTLGFYNRGKQFPQFLIDGINGALQSVMLPALSSRQNRTSDVKNLMRNSILMSSYILFPLMALLAGVAEPLITWLLTDKWLPAAPYMQIYCFTMAIFPIHTCNLQAINAIGRSDIFLKLEIIKKILSLVLLVAAIVFFDSPIMIAWT